MHFLPLDRRATQNHRSRLALKYKGFRAMLNILFWQTRAALCNLVSPNHAQGDAGICYMHKATML